MPWFNNLHLRTKFNLILSLLLVCLFIAAALLTYRKQQQLILRFAEDNARNLARQIIVTRDYMSDVVKDEAGKNYDLVPQVVATQVAKKITAGSPYYVRQVSLRFRNSDNKPDNYETARLENFTRQGMAESSSMETVDGKRTFRYLHPMVAIASCLACHGDYEKAPAFVRASFPRGHNSYNYKVGEVIGAVSVSIPLADLYRQIGANLKQDLLYRAVIFCIIILVMGWMLRRSIIDPVKQLAVSISMVTRTGSYADRLPRLTNDEIGTLIGSFNDLMQELELKDKQGIEADARYRSFTEMVPSAVVTCVQDGRIIISNKRAEKLFGVSHKDLIGESIFNFITGEAARNELFATYLENGRIRLVKENSFQPVRCYHDRLIQMEISIAVSEGDQQPLFTVMLREIPTT